ncbi:MAG TPA: hypothetical protein VFF04_02690 [Candidatus Babeliales bacterium]|nr:hypothetical protein [Candidatus Babeliales bacterium]
MKRLLLALLSIAALATSQNAYAAMYDIIIINYTPFRAQNVVVHTKWPCTNSDTMVIEPGQWVRHGANCAINAITGELVFNQNTCAGLSAQASPPAGGTFIMIGQGGGQTSGNVTGNTILPIDAAGSFLPPGCGGTGMTVYYYIGMIKDGAGNWIQKARFVRSADTPAGF